MRARDNPLSVQRLQELRYRAPDADLPALAAAFARAGHRGAVVGPEGHGKTTLVRDLTARFAAEGWDVRQVRLQRAQRAFSRGEGDVLRRGLHRRALLVVDGLDELSVLSRWRLRRWAKDAGGLLVAAHREGFVPTLWRCRTSPELLAALLGELGLAPERPDAGAPEAAAAALFAAHRGNLREVFFALYDAYARLPDRGGSGAAI